MGDALTRYQFEYDSDAEYIETLKRNMFDDSDIEPPQISSRAPVNDLKRHSLELAQSHSEESTGRIMAHFGRHHGDDDDDDEFEHSDQSVDAESSLNALSDDEDEDGVRRHSDSDSDDEDDAER